MRRVGRMDELQNLAAFLMADGCEWLTGRPSRSTAPAPRHRRRHVLRTSTADRRRLGARARDDQGAERPRQVAAFISAEDHAVPRAHRRAVRQPRLAALGGLRRRELLRAFARARVPRHPQRGGAVRRLAALQVPGARHGRGAPARSRHDARRRAHAGRARCSTRPGATRRQGARRRHRRAPRRTSRSA